MPGQNQGQNPYGRSSTTWATMRASTAQSDSQPATVSPQAPQWKPRGVHVSPPAPKLESFPALGATNQSSPTTSCIPDVRSHSSTATAAEAQKHKGQGNRAPCSSNTQQPPVRPSALPRRRSLSAPSLAAAAEPALLRPFSAVAGSSNSSRRRSSSVGRGKGHTLHPTFQAEPQQHPAGHKSLQQTPQLQQQAALAPHHKQPQAGVQQHQQQQHQQQHQQQEEQVDQQQLHTSLQLLQECHPWCDAVMLHEVLQAFQGDVAAALEALEHMLPAGTDTTANLPPSSSSNSSGSDSDSSINDKLLGSPAAAAAAAAVMGSRRGCEGGGTVPHVAANQAVQPDKALQAARQHQLWPAGPEDEAAGGQPAQQMTRQQQQHQQQQQVPQQVVCQAGQPGSHQAQQQAAGGPEDTYRDLRGQAVRLSHKYRKASRKAAAARACGEYSAAAQLAADAVVLKQAADAAHAAAAIKIEVTNNMDRPDGLWELDLHGLHVAEALQALHARVELLQEVAQDLKQQVTASANTLAAPAVDRQQPQSQQAIASGAGTSRKQAVLTSLLLPDEQVLSWEQQLAALRQELRVIVGKGLHSSGGEASLPRAVEQWLLQRRYKYIWRGGCIGVQLKLL